jgi:hypothetical protein
MRSSDTDADSERVQVELMRRAPLARRSALALSLSQSMIGLSRNAIRRSMPDASDEDVAVRFVELHYGVELASGLRRYLQARSRS